MTDQTTNFTDEPNSPAVEKAIQRFHAALACTCHRSGRHQPWCRVFDGNSISDKDRSDLRVAALIIASMSDQPAAQRIVATLNRLSTDGNGVAEDEGQIL